MRINWFSPLPPAKTDIGHFTARILPALTKHAEVKIWTNLDQWDEVLGEHAEVVYYQPESIQWRDLNHADMTFYNIGNNRLFHNAIWQTSQRHPGIVILHDLWLQEFFHQMFYNQLKDPDSYQQHMARFYGEEGRKAVEANRCGLFPMDELRESFPLTQLGTDNALGVVVHTAQAYKAITTEQAIPCCQLPLPYAGVKSLSRQGAKPPSQPYRLVLFGYIGPNRQLLEILDALATFPDNRFFTLDVYGELWAEALVMGKIKASGMKGQVKIHGFVTEEELNSALTRADMAINLRNPTMGEASGSQLRIWSHALPSLVSHVGWYADLPEETVSFVRPGHEVKDIQAHLSAFLENPRRYADQGQAGCKQLHEKHAPETYAAALLDFAKIVAEHRSASFIDSLAKKVGTDIGGWRDPVIAKEFTLNVSKQICKMLS